MNTMMAQSGTGLPSQGSLQKYTPGPKHLAFLQPSVLARARTHIPAETCLTGVV